MRNNLFNFFLFWLRASEKYDRLESDPSKRDSAILGVESILMSIFGILTAAGLAWLAYICFTVDGLAVILTFIFGIASAIGAILCFFQLLVASIIYAAYQMRLNDRAIGKVALAISLVMLLLAIIAIIILLVMISRS